jgi:hypothetical protein
MVSGWKLEEKGPHGTLGCRCEDNIKILFKEIRTAG